MKKFLYDPDNVDPVDVASRDNMVFFVESIVSHRGNLNCSSIEFLFKWRDYPESENTWEPYSILRDIEILHDYLKLRSLHSLINERHR